MRRHCLSPQELVARHAKEDYFAHRWGEWVSRILGKAAELVHRRHLALAGRYIARARSHYHTQWRGPLYHTPGVYHPRGPGNNDGRFPDRPYWHFSWRVPPLHLPNGHPLWDHPEDHSMARGAVPCHMAPWHGTEHH